MCARLINVFIDEKPVRVPLGYTIMQSCASGGVEVPRFCYHDKLLIAGNCRICLVELMGSKKLLASCAVHSSDTNRIYTNTARVKLARQNVLEFLLANHPLDCPICDQGGECDLQDITAIFGADRGRFYESVKRAVLNKDFGPLIRTSMNRCIHCTRCVRFLSISAGMPVLGTLGRGVSTEIGAYVDHFLSDELSGNITDLCPVGALTSKPYSFRARPWELVSVESVDTFDALNSTLIVDIAANKISRILPYANEVLNSGWLTNRARYAYDGLFFQRLSSPLLQINYLNTIRSDFAGVLSKLKKFFIKVSNRAAVLIFLKKLYSCEIQKFYVETGFSADMETLFVAGEFSSILGGRCMSSIANKHSNLQDFSNIFLFNTSLVELAKMPSFVLFVGSNPRLESPLINLKLTALQSDFNIPFYRIGASIAYFTFFVRLISNNIRAFFDVCEFKHPFCKNFYKKSFAFRPFFLIGAQLFNSSIGSLLILATLTLVSRIRLRILNFYSFSLSNLNEFASFSVLGLYSGWVQTLDFSYSFSVLDCATIGVDLVRELPHPPLKKTFLYYNVNASSAYLLQSLSHCKNIWKVFQGSHGDGIVNFVNLIFPTTTYIERTSVYRNLLGIAQKSSPAILYNRSVLTDKEVFCSVLEVASKFFFNRFFNFNFTQALHYNITLRFTSLFVNFSTNRALLLPVGQLQNGSDSVVEACNDLANFLGGYYYSLTYWAYFSYIWKVKFTANSYLVHLIKIHQTLYAQKLFISPISSAIINYYSDLSLPILTASRVMNSCSTLYLKKNLSILSLNL